ncbi:MAG TPA: DNA repair protein RecO [Ignavibacteria bacterium]|nr:DNA repair protein RecO [Ignavibacteria bacterium]
MSLVRTEGIVLKTFKYSDSSKIVTIFSKETGKFNALVKGARNLKSKTSGIYNLINKIDVHFNKKETRDLQVISKAEVLDSYNNLKSDFDSLSIGYRVIEILNLSLTEYYINQNLYNFTNVLLNQINNTQNSGKSFLLYFQIGFLEKMGLNFLSVSNVKSLYETNLVSDAFNIKIEDFDQIREFYGNGMSFESSNSKESLTEQQVDKFINAFDTIIKNNFLSNRNFRTKQILKDIAN